MNVDSQDTQVQQALSVGVLDQAIHEIATPLAVIEFLTEELREAEIAERGLQRQLLCEQIVKNVSHIREVLKNQSALLTGEDRPAFAPVDLADVVGDAIALMTYPLRSAGVEIDYSFEALNGEVSGNRTLLLQVMINLVNNALEAANLTRDKWVTIKVLRDGKMGEVQFMNSGEAISQIAGDELLRGPVSAKGKNRGLGLRICQKILSEHGGTIRLNHDFDHTCFSLHLPLVSQP